MKVLDIDESKITVGEIPDLWEKDLYDKLLVGESEEYHMYFDSTGQISIHTLGAELSPAYLKAFIVLMGKGVFLPVGFGNPEKLNFLVFEPSKFYFKIK